MELSDFVAQTLIELVRGVSRAQEEVSKLGGYVNPAAFVRASADSHFGTMPGHHQQVFLADFDVAVTASESTGTNAGAKVQIASLVGLGAGGNSSETHQTVSHIKFRVPFALPVDAKSKLLMERHDREVEAAADRAHRHTDYDRI
jgi:1-aminocyclopropane-1-carboxylate deaminase/D-cysteine desulfhydrase-like pyridoxal-dependent ACC family enzyme